jgi:hypothetical protein
MRHFTSIGHHTMSAQNDRDWAALVSGANTPDPYLDENEECAVCGGMILGHVPHDCDMEEPPCENCGGGKVVPDPRGGWGPCPDCGDW